MRRFSKKNKNDFSSFPLSLSLSLPLSDPKQQTKRAQISEVAGKAQAKVQELVGEVKK